MVGAEAMKPLTIKERQSLAAFRGWQTRRHGKQEVPKCPGCGEPLTDGALNHMKRRHVDLYQRRAKSRGELV